MVISKEFFFFLHMVLVYTNNFWQVYLTYKLDPNSVTGIRTRLPRCLAFQSLRYKYSPLVSAIAS